MKLASFLVVLLLLGVTTLTVAAEAPWAIKGTPSGHFSRTFVREYPVFGADATTVVGTQAWRVANSTGNCCENHITVTSAGRIIDIGAAYPIFSDDGGVTWKRFVPTPGPFLGAEGSGANAPNGDWVGVTWDPYTGDRVMAYKYVAAEDAWYSSNVALHGPVYDRPFVGVVPGPITVAGATYPYAVLMRGGVGAKTTYVSYDGLTYALASPGELSLVERTTEWLDQPAGVAWADWVQPIASSRVVPLPGGGALASATLCAWFVFDTDGSTRCMKLGDGSSLGASSAPRFDSKGRLHAFEAVRGGINHRMSTDGGRTWTNHTLPLPANASYQGGMLDAVANGALDTVVVGVRADVFRATGPTTKIFIYKITDVSTTPQVKIMQVGNGDRYFSQGVNSPYARMDFMTLGLLPDGRVVTTFGDWIHSSPRLAVEQP